MGVEHSTYYYLWHGPWFCGDMIECDLRRYNVRWSWLLQDNQFAFPLYDDRKSNVWNNVCISFACKPKMFLTKSRKWSSKGRGWPINMVTAPRSVVSVCQNLEWKYQSLQGGCMNRVSDKRWVDELYCMVTHTLLDCIHCVARVTTCV